MPKKIESSKRKQDNVNTIMDIVFFILLPPLHPSGSSYLVYHKAGQKATKGCRN
jgi:hypothetical protein